MGTVKEELGWLPESIWHLTKNSDYNWGLFIKDKGDPAGMAKQKGSEDKKEYPYSKFNPLLAERILRYWSQPDANVLDPFAGRTTRGIVSIVMGRNYEGYEVAPKTYEVTANDLKRVVNSWQPGLFGDSKIGNWDLHLADGTKLENTKDNSKDLILTCPPYFDVEIYEEAIGQLSRLGDYKTFLLKIRECAQNCYKKLKYNRYCVWVVADFRRQGRFIPFHSDIMEQFNKWTAFKPWDVVINRLNSPFVTGAAQAMEAKHSLKIHEFILVWKK